jgi:branched-chain amino acid aminotransferase
MNTIWINGQILPATAPILSVQDRGFLLGDGCFSTLIAPSGQPFRLAAHWQRLLQTAAWLGIDCPYSVETVAEAARALLSGETAGLRLTLSRGAAGRGLLPTENTPPVLVVSPFPLLPPPAPARITVAPWAVVASNPVLGYKLTSYSERIAAYRQARAAGFDETLFLNTEGLLTSAAAANLFLVRDGTLLTPPTTDGLLPGITRQVVLDAAAAAGIPVAVRSLTLADLLTAEEIFLTNSRAGLWPVAAVQEKAYSTTGAVTRTLDAIYQTSLHSGQAG